MILDLVYLLDLGISFFQITIFEEIQNKMSDKEVPGQWIGELFRPTYSFTVEDVLAPQDEGPIKSKIKRVAAFDPDAIQQVYEKVRIMNILENEIKQQTRQREIAELAGE